MGIVVVPSCSALVKIKLGKYVRLGLKSELTIISRLTLFSSLESAPVKVVGFGT